MNQKKAVCVVLGLVALTVSVRWACLAASFSLQSGYRAQAALKEISIPEMVCGDMPEQMPIQNTDSGSFVGILDIPALRLELPVQEKWSEAHLQTAPCRYAGTAYAKGFVIAAYDYRHHFGQIETLRTGDSVLFTDVQGRKIAYTVQAVETLSHAVGTATDPQWDLTLFTYSPDGGDRVAVRCEMQNGLTS